MVRKYCTTRTDAALATKFKGKKPEEMSIIKLKNQNAMWSLMLYQAKPDWLEHTMAVGAVLFVPEKVKKNDILTFDLFYDAEDILEFWEKHHEGFQAIDVDPEMFPTIDEADRDLNFAGGPVDIETPSAWAETYAASLFFDRGWATHDEIEDAVLHAHWLRMFLDAVKEGEALWFPPEEGDIEINSRFASPDNGDLL